MWNDMSTDEQETNRQPVAGKRKKISVAFLGGAYNSAVGKVHRIAIEMDQRFELVAGCFSRDSEENSKTAELYGVGEDRIYASIDDLLKNEKSQLDAIVILTPQDQHMDQVLDCLDAGLPVVCEKALVASVRDALAIRDRLAETGGFLAVTYNYTGYPMFRELGEMIRQDKLGKIQQIHIEMPQEGFSKLALDGSPIVPQDWRLRDEKIPTISLDLGVHLHMAISFLTNEKPEKLVAVGDSLGNFSQITDNIICTAKYTNNLTCNIWYSKTAFGYRNGLKVRVFGDKGSGEWFQDNPEYLNIADEYGRKFILDRASPDAKISNEDRYTRFKAGHPAGFIEAFANYYCDIADALDQYRRNNSTANPYVFGIDEALEGIMMLEAIAESCSSCSWVEL
jgi:predicted dehydrogenase